MALCRTTYHCDVGSEESERQQGMSGDGEQNRDDDPEDIAAEVVDQTATDWRGADRNQVDQTEQINAATTSQVLLFSWLNETDNYYYLLQTVARLGSNWNLLS